MVFSKINKKGDDAKVRDLYDKYKNLMYSMAYEILKDKNFSEDAVQESFIKIIKNIHKIKQADCSETRNFICIICRNTAINIYKKRNRNSEYYKIKDYYNADENYVDVNFNVEEIIINEESLKHFWEYINKLEPIYRDVIIFKYKFEYNAKEISEIFCISVEAVNKRIYRAKQKLNKLMKGFEGNE